VHDPTADCCPDVCRSTRRWRSHIVVQLRRPSRIHSTHDGFSIPSFPLKRVHTFSTVCLLPTPLTNWVYCLGAVTAILTNPICAVKIRTVTAPPNSPAAHRGLWSASLCLFEYHHYQVASRRLPRDIPRRRSAQPLPRYLTRAIRRQQRRTTVHNVHGIREDERLGIRAETATGGEARTCRDD
jgi:hypothetical protein